MGAANWSEGQVIRGRYRILGELGQGGVGKVYKAEDLRLKDLCALKVLSPDLAREPGGVKRFEEAATLARQLHHPNAVKVIGFDEDEDGRCFIEMEFLEGQTLRKIVQADRSLSGERACSIAAQVASALAVAHDWGIVHGSIKPDNIMLVQTPDGERAKVLDIGMARVREMGLSPTQGVASRGSGKAMGTPAYLSPEQALGRKGDELDGRADVYSLGIVLYRMLAGQLPLRATSEAAMITAHIEVPPLSLSSVRRDIPEPLAKLVMKCLEKQIDRRPTARDLIRKLAVIERAGPQSGPPSGEPIFEGVRLSRYAAVIALGLSVCGLAIYVARTGLPRVPGVNGSASAPAARVLPRNSAQHGGPVGLPVPSPSNQGGTPTASSETSVRDVQLPSASVASSALKMAPDSREALDHSRQASELVGKHDWIGAISEFRKAIHLDPNLVAPHFGLAVVLQEKGNLSGAIEEMRTAIRLDPGDGNSHSLLADWLEQSGDVAGAVQELREALRLEKPSYITDRASWEAGMHSALGHALEKEGNLTDAREQYRIACESEPDNKNRDWYCAAYQHLSGK